MVLVLSVGAVVAVPENDNRVGSPDEECQEHFGDGWFGIAKWEYEDGSFVLSEEGELDGYDTSVEGDDEEATWTSVPDAQGVLHKEGQDTYTHAGGAQGTIQSEEYGISHITLCGNGQEIPEMPVVLGGLALVGAIGLVALRR